MKKYLTGIILFAFILTCLILMTSCSKDEPAETLPETTVPVAVTTEEAVAVSVDPITAASRGLQFNTNGDGTCTLTGIGTCADMCLIIPDKSDGGEKVVKIAASAFAGNTTITAVQIPAGVTEIGAGAFAGCPKLAYISVADGNTVYTDMGGVLYSKDGSALICVPAGSSYASLTLTKKVTKIADSATYGCVALKKILYDGSKDDWKAISIGAGNTVLTSAEVTYLTQTGK